MKHLTRVSYGGRCRIRLAAESLVHDEQDALFGIGRVVLPIYRQRCYNERDGTVATGNRPWKMRRGASSNNFYFSFAWADDVRERMIKNFERIDISAQNFSEIGLHLRLTRRPRCTPLSIGDKSCGRLFLFIQTSPGTVQ